VGDAEPGRNENAFRIRIDPEGSLEILRERSFDFMPD